MKTENDKQSMIYQQLVAWFDDVKEHELINIIELVEQAKLLLNAAETLPEEKVKQFVENFKYDLAEFYQQYQSDVKHSIYLGLLGETFWQTIASVTDKTQVEWAELTDDFAHDGFYRAGDYIGFGELECQTCNNKTLISHNVKITECIHCGGEQFQRHGLNP